MRVNGNDPCAYQKLNPTILTMKSAEDWPSNELAEALDRPMARRILAQGQMRSQFVVIDGVGCKDLAQVGLAEDDDVIEAFSADRADQSFRMPVLPGRPRGDQVIAYTHGCKALRDGVAVAPVTIPDHVIRCLIPGEGICDLTGDPLRSRMVGDAQGYQPSPRCEGGPKGRLTLRSIELTPISLGRKDARHRRGRPRLAEVEEGSAILDRFASLSRPFGTELCNDGRSVRLA